MPIFRPGPGPYALAFAMTGIKPGERLLYVGCDAPALFGALAARAGLTGRVAAVAGDARGQVSLEKAGADAGALVEVVKAASASLPFDAESFDIVVFDATAHAPERDAPWLPEARRVLRQGGRLIVTERTGGGLFGGRLKSGTKADAALRLLEAHGFAPARVIADRDGWRFTEGLKR